ncbi:MAG: patatin-like phospholipase family protein [Sphingomonas phyllosphaerae]
MSVESEGFGATGEGPQALPDFEAAQFDLTDPPECDMVMKGGVTSGIVYPYAILQIATKFRLRSLGGTSAGAIAAAFAAAAEYGRQTGRPEAFLVLKNYCDELPERLLSLFQPTPDLEPAVQSVKAAMASGGVGPLLRRGLSNAALPALAGASVAGGTAWLAQPSVLATGLAATLGAVIAGGFVRTIGRPLGGVAAQPLGVEDALNLAFSACRKQSHE